MKTILTLRRGSEILYRGDSLQTAMLQNAALLTFDRQTFRNIAKSICSQESAFGPLRSATLVYPTTSRFGQRVALANLSARQAKAMGLMTSGTYGRTSNTSSSGASLSALLASRLRVKTDSLGSTLFNLTWKERTTPSGRSIPALRASVRRISDSDCIGLLPAHWITPQTHDVTTRGNTLADHHYGPHDLSNQVALASWPTPDTMSGPHGPRGVSSNPNHQSAKDLQATCRLASWPTPQSRDGSHGGGQPTRAMGEGRHGSNLDDFAMLAGWPTPTDYKGAPSKPYSERGGGKKGMGLDAAADHWLRSGITGDPNWDGPARLTATGQILIGSAAGMEGGGQLRAGHSHWLMGNSPEWESCAPTAIKSSGRKPRRS